MKKLIISLIVCAAISALNVNVFAGFSEIRADAGFIGSFDSKTQSVTVSGGVPVNYSIRAIARVFMYPYSGSTASALASVREHDNTRHTVYCSANDSNPNANDSRDGVMYACCVADRIFTLYVEASAGKGCHASANAKLTW